MRRLDIIVLVAAIIITVILAFISGVGDGHGRPPPSTSAASSARVSGSATVGGNPCSRRVRST
jgi:hypothetical protein